MGESPGQLKLLKCHRPAMLPVKSQATEHENGCENPEKSAIGSAMQSGQQRGMTGSTTGRQ